MGAFFVLASRRKRVRDIVGIRASAGIIDEIF